MRRVGKRAIESMVKVGVFDKWGTRTQFLDALDRITGYSGKTHDAAAAGQMSLFGGVMATAVDVSVDLLRPASEVDPIDHRQLLDWEKELIGVYLSEHPLERTLAPILNSESNGFITTIEIDTNSNDKQVKMAGIISYLRPHTTKKGDAMAFAALEDLHGRVDIIFFPRTWKQCRDQVQMDQILVIQGKVQVRDDSITVIVDRVTKKVEISQDADASNEEDYDAGWMNGSAEYGHGNGNGHENGGTATAPPLPPQIAEPAPVLTTPPPPPNFEEEETVATQPAVTAVKTKPKRPETPSPPPRSRPETNKVRTVVVEIKPVGNWREACRQALAKSGQFEGSDRISMRLAGSRLAMDFPNQSTRLCPDLLESLRMVPGIARVYEG
jgi:DNA polymerase-3 subunit alpha